MVLQKEVWQRREDLDPMGVWVELKVMIVLVMARLVIVIERRARLLELVAILVEEPKVEWEYWRLVGVGGLKEMLSPDRKMCPPWRF